ncbi:PepSY-associated TM helix domain-containing protein [Candidatus Methylobacter oryzae]|uniref:PepSY domain-containing protein n=1 Tax=Candidatus Methylobacter oryzae TaxID=2497749 RepID=A0ABY3CEI4_9GAMM|nr:PepSY-associated TM helix domain-containing protein [Candidatus Methylobacter oryzae]TRX01443.1 PepSY domain-containing protein [Candidatus Methylobacter oryzae]
MRQPFIKDFSALSSVTISKADIHLAKLKARRKLWLDVHLYLGLIVGAILAVVGLTGCILVFYQEMQEVLNPELAVVSAPPENRQQVRGLDDIVAAAESAKPRGSRFFKVYYPRKPDVAYKLLYYVRDESLANNGDGYYIFVDPYKAQVQGIQLWHPKDRYWGRPLVSFIMQLHWCLLLGKQVGGTLNCVMAALSIISLLTGLIVWWPLTGKFKQALTFKRNGSAVRFNFDLHKTFGFYSAIVLLPVLFSGVYMVLPERVNVLIKLFSPVSRPHAYSAVPAGIHSKPQEGRQPVTIAEVEAIVQKHYPAGKLWMLNGPKNREDVYTVMKHDVIELSRFIGYRDIAVDQYSGEIINVFDRGTGNAGDIFTDWQWPLHNGHAFGWTGRMLVFLSGLACPLLYVTGLVRWQQKRKAKKLKRIVELQKQR